MGWILKRFVTPIDGLVVLESTPLADSRGAFERLYCENEIKDVLAQRRVVQINRSLTIKAGTVRGLHFQYAPHAEMKLVRCLKGRVWDVAVDLRANSSTLFKWFAQELSPANALMMVIPEGFAHGFQVLEPDSELLYIHTEFYSPNSEGGLRYNDPKLGIKWPIPITEISPRDANHTFINSNYQGLQI